MRESFLVAIGILLAQNPATSCTEFYPHNQIIAPSNTIELCNSFYVTRYDETKHLAVFSSELAKPNHTSVARTDDFHSDPRLRNSPTNADYKSSHYDRGHLVPAEDASTTKEMEDTFLLSNMTPQSSKLNRNNWKLLEEKVRKEVNAANKNIVIVTGAIYDNSNSTIGASKIPIPIGYYKIVYLNKIEVYYAKNTDDATIQQISISDLQKMLNYEIKQ